MPYKPPVELNMDDAIEAAKKPLLTQEAAEHIKAAAEENKNQGPYIENFTYGRWTLELR